MTPKKLPRKKEKLARSRVPPDADPTPLDEPEADPDAPTWGSEGGAGEYRGGPTSQDDEAGTIAPQAGGDRDHPPGGRPKR